MRTSSRSGGGWRVSRRPEPFSTPVTEDIPELPLGAKDTEIFQEIGADSRNLLFITRDKKIRTRPVERRKLREAGVRAVILTGRSNMTQDDIYHLIVKHWDEIADLDASRIGPCIFSLTSKGLSRVVAPSLNPVSG